jgi:flagellar basal body L-ring protein FlgH
LSYNIADATIQFLSKGTITDSQKKGWFTKVWDKVSPF